MLPPLRSTSSARRLSRDARAVSDRRRRRFPLSRPDISEADIQSVVDVLRTPFLSLGPKLKEFEAAFCDYTGARFATAMSSGTAALHLAVKALNIQPGDEVITSPFSFVASANCALFVDALPVFVDIDPTSFNLDRASDRAPHHAADQGHPAGARVRPARRHGRGARHRAAPTPARHRGRLRGASARAGAGGTSARSATSEPSPSIPTSRSPRAKVASRHRRSPSWIGCSRASATRDAAPPAAWLQHERLGFNYRLSDINCALGLSQLARLERCSPRRRAVAEEYRRHLGGFEELELPLVRRANAEMSWFVYVVRLKGFGRAARDEVLQALQIGRHRLQQLLRAAAFACPIFDSSATRPATFPSPKRWRHRRSPCLSTTRCRATIRRICDVLRERCKGSAPPRSQQRVTSAAR